MLKKDITVKVMLIVTLAFLLIAANTVPSVTSASDTQDTIYNVKQFGAVGNGINDDTSAIASAIASAASAGGGTVLLPVGQYKVTSTLTVPAFVSMVGVSRNSAVTVSSVSIIGSLSLSPVVQLNGGAGSASTALKNLTVTRESGTIPSGVIGVLVASTDYTVMEDVNIYRHAIGYKIIGQLGFKADRVISYGATQAYCVIENIVKPSFTDCSFGRNGGELSIGPPTSYVEISGSADTISFLRCQFNATTSTPSTNGIYFKSFNNPNCNNAIVSDAATPAINRLMMSACTFNIGYALNFTNLNSATNPAEWCITGNEITGRLNLSRGTGMTISGNRFVGIFNISASSIALTGNTFHSSGTVSGAFDNLAFTGNVFNGSGQSLTDNATGQKTILGNVSTSGTSNKEALSNNYLKLGNGVSYGVKRYTGTLDANGCASITHGMYVGHQAGLLMQAWYKGNSGEMVPMTVNYMDGGTIRITGGTASRSYRLTVMYSDELNAW